MRVDVFDLVAVDYLDQERVMDGDWVDLDVDVQFDLAPVLLVGVGAHVHSGDVTEGGLIVRVNLLYLEPVFKEFSVHVE